MSWREIEPREGELHFINIDRVYNAARAAGQRPLLTILFAPPWTYDPSESCANPPDCKLPPAPQFEYAMGNFAAAVAQRYPDAAGIEIWNEPNLKVFWEAPIDPVRYTRLVKAAYAGVKAVNPNMPVITGGLSAYYGEIGSTPGMSMNTFLAAMYAAGIKGHQDGIGIHPYPGGLNPWYGYRALSTALKLRAMHRDPSKLWLTELGANTTASGAELVSEANQARQLSRIIPALRARPEVGGVYVHTLYERDTTSADRGYSVLRIDGSPKPAYCALAQTCTAPGPDATQNERWRAQDLLQDAAEAAMRRYFETGTYLGTPGLPMTENATPGPTADPSKIYVSVAAGGKELLLCNASKIDKTYCIYNPRDGDFVHGSGTGGIFATAGAITTGGVWWW